MRFVDESSCGRPGGALVAVGVALRSLTRVTRGGC